MERMISYEDVPTLVQIETTYACNQHCAFCYNPKRGDKLNLDVLDKIVDSISKSQIPHVYFIGGEPSLVPEEKLNEYIEKLSPYSSMAIVTNGTILLKNISHKISCLAIPLHGVTAEEHDLLTGVKGSFDKTVKNIRYYVAHGYDVRCVLVLTGYNYNKMYSMIKFAANLGMESVYVDRYEDGGLGATVSKDMVLKPTLAQFREGVRQILDARDDFGIFGGRIGFGTAIPMCIDERLLKENMTSTCGVGSTFCAINPDGFLRICNQSEVKFGNVMEEPIEQIWRKDSLKIYRDLSWVDEPCKSCKLLEECQCGCKVDANYSDKFCIDFAVREDIDDIMRTNIERINEGAYDKYIFGIQEMDLSYPEGMRIFKINKYTKIHEKYNTKKVVTKYRTISLDEMALTMIKDIMENNIVNERELIERYREFVEVEDIRKFVSELLQSDVIEQIGEIKQ